MKAQEFLELVATNNVVRREAEVMSVQKAHTRFAEGFKVLRGSFSSWKRNESVMVLTMNDTEAVRVGFELTRSETDEITLMDTDTRILTFVVRIEGLREAFINAPETERAAIDLESCLRVVYNIIIPIVTLKSYLWRNPDTQERVLRGSINAKDIAAWAEWLVKNLNTYFQITLK